MTVRAAPARAGDNALPASWVSDRVTVGLLLGGIYTLLSAVYIVEAWRRVTPWLFSDEIEFTALSRSIAETGHPSRLGQAHSADSVYTYLTAPFWYIHNVASAYDAVKYFDVLVMTTVVFSTYFLARMVVGRTAALFAATGAGAVPALAYSSFYLQEPLSYPYAALSFLLIAKALVHPFRGRRPTGWAIAAVVDVLVAPAVKGELVVIPAVFALAVVLAVLSSNWARARRARWSRGDWAGATLLAAGSIILVSAILSTVSAQWAEISVGWKHRAFVLGDWSAGALAIGLGVVPLVVGLAALVPARGEPRDRNVRLFRCTAIAGFVWFGLYTGVKAAFLANHFDMRAEERDLIYVIPLLFVGTALVLDRRRVNLLALVGACAYVVYLVIGTPYFMDRGLYFDSFGYAIVEQAAADVGWTPGFAQWLLLGITLGGTLAIVVIVRYRRSLIGAAVATVLAVGVLGWTFTGELAASAGTNSAARFWEAKLRHPFGWVDSATHGAKTIYLAQGVNDAEVAYELIFWNRSIKTLSTLDASLVGPLTGATPNITANGTIYWTNNPHDLSRQYAYAVEDWPCVDFRGTKRAIHDYRAGGKVKQWRLIQLSQPNQLLAECTGISPDGWTGPSGSDYFRYTGGAHGWLRIVVSRRDWSGATGPSPFHIKVGPLTSGANEQPALASVRRKIDGTIDSGQTKVVWVRSPGPSFGAEVTVDKLFEPHAYDPRLYDTRHLGVELTYRFFAKRPRA